MTAWVIPLLVGCGTGILSSWGVGGGTLLLLIMTLLLDVPPGDAMAVNLLYFLPTAGMGLVQHRKNGLLDGEVLRAAVPCGVLAAVAAAWLSTAIDAVALRRPFGVYLLLAAAGTVRRG